jgi:hypothetical protein
MNIALRTAIQNEKRTLESEYEDLEKQITALRTEREAVSVRLGHIVALLKEPGSEETETQASSLFQPEVAQEASDPIEIAYRILEEKGPDPVHYRELADLVKQRGGSLQGSNPALALISRLVLDDRFVRPFRRGWYALRKYYPKSKNVGRRRSTTHRRRSTV